MWRRWASVASTTIVFRLDRRTHTCQVGRISCLHIRRMRTGQHRHPAAQRQQPQPNAHRTPPGGSSPQSMLTDTTNHLLCLLFEKRSGQSEIRSGDATEHIAQGRGGFGSDFIFERALGMAPQFLALHQTVLSIGRDRDFAALRSLPTANAAGHDRRDRVGEHVAGVAVHHHAASAEARSATGPSGRPRVATRWVREGGAAGRAPGIQLGDAAGRPGTGTAVAASGLMATLAAGTAKIQMVASFMPFAQSHLHARPSHWYTTRRLSGPEGDVAMPIDIHSRRAIPR